MKNQIIDQKTIKISSFQLNPDNPRLIRDVKFHSLVESIKRDPEFLEKRGIVHAEGVILGGNQRYLAIKEALKDDSFRSSLSLDKGTIPISWVQDASDWPEEKRRRFVIVDNGSWGENDFDILANKWADLPLIDLGVDIPPDWLSSLSQEEIADAEPQIDRAEELNKTWGVKSGDLWRIGYFRNKINTTDGTSFCPAGVAKHPGWLATRKRLSALIAYIHGLIIPFMQRVSTPFYILQRMTDAFPGIEIRRIE